MKKTVKIISSFLAIMLVALCFASCSLKGGDTTQFKANADGYALYRYKGSSVEKTYTVPDEYEGKAVTELMAFSLANAEYLETINIGKNIKTIDVWALTNCPMLKSVNVSEENPNFCSVDGVLYTKDMSALLAYPNGKTPLKYDAKNNVIGGGEIVIPETVKEIRENAFYLCGNLYSVTFNEGLEKIGNKAFLKCGNIRKLDFPSTLKEIGADAFSYCGSLTALEIPASVEKIDDYAFFSGGSKIKKIVVHKHIDESKRSYGENWIPTKEGSVREKVPVEYVGA